MNERLLEAFNENVRNRVNLKKMITSIKEKIKPMQKTLKQLVKEEKKCNKEICEFMKSYTISICNLPKELNSGAIKYSETEKLVPMTHEYFKNSLIEFFNDYNCNIEFDKLKPEEKGLYLFNYIKTNRPRIHSETLRSIKYTNIDKTVDEYEILNEL